MIYMYYRYIDENYLFGSSKESIICFVFFTSLDNYEFSLFNRKQKIKSIFYKKDIEK